MPMTLKEAIDYLQPVADSTELAGYGAALAVAVSAMRELEELRKEPKDEQTNADRIRAMTDEELAEMLSQMYYSCTEPWCHPFARKFCDSCPKPEYTLEDGRKMNLHECDFSDGKCPHGSDLIWWLQQPVEEVQGDG